MDAQFLRSKKAFWLALPFILVSVFLIPRFFEAKETFVPFPPDHHDKQVWAIYNPGYGNPHTDGSFRKWNQIDKSRYSREVSPPSTLGSVLYPQMGPYSSHDRSVLRQHCKMARDAGIDSFIVEWSGIHDNFTIETFELLLGVSIEFGIRIGVEIGTYSERTNQTIFHDIQFILERYQHHESLLKIHGRPVILVREAAHIREMPNILYSHRKTIFAVATIRERVDVGVNLESWYEGNYLCPSSENITWASTLSNWEYLAADAARKGIQFIPTVSPGFIQEKSSRSQNWLTRSRESGAYYERMWEAAVGSGASIVLVNSFNNWLQGTQIEPAMEIDGYEFTEATWGENSEHFLVRTKYWAAQLKNKHCM